MIDIDPDIEKQISLIQEDKLNSKIKEDIKKYSNYLNLKLGYVKYSDVFILKKRLDILKDRFNGLIILS